MPLIGQTNAVALSPTPSQPLTSIDPYTYQMTSTTQMGENVITVHFLKGKTVTGEFEVDCCYECESGSVSRTTGRSFFLFKKDAEKRIEIYEKDGKRILDFPGQDLASSDNGRFAVYAGLNEEVDVSSGKKLFIRDVDRHFVSHFHTVVPGVPKSVSDNGKLIVLWCPSRHSELGNFSVISNKGKKIWEIAGFYKFNGFSDGGKRVSFLNIKTNNVEYYDSESGRSLLKITQKMFRLIKTTP